LALPCGFEVVVPLDRDSAPWLLQLEAAPARLVVRQPSYERLTEAAERDVDLPEFFARFRHVVPVEGVPACVLGRPERVRPEAVDGAMLAPEGRLEIFRYTRRFLREHYRTKSLRCRSCTHEPACRGVHINYARAHGYASLKPVETI
jgi:hypothetical protein